ncbi:glycosyltransferase [Candidatus Saccharibacteria bacterium]|nr:glycosyltransferase [Candidatus Saccharibacteria bacterium]
MDKISVIIPVYNSSSFLKDCYGSLKRQTYSNLELIFVNDGSTDNSLDLLKGIAMADERVVIVDQENGGVSAARNAGIKKATGKYLTFLDPDDFFADDAVQYLYELIKKDSNISISACSHIESCGDKQKDFNNGTHKTRTLNVEDGLKCMLNEQGFNLQTTVKLYEKDLFNDVAFPEGMLHEDVGTTYKLFINAYKKGSRIAYGSKSKYYYRMREDSAGHKRFSAERLDLIILTDQMCDDIDAVFEDLKNTTNLRRLHARFSILRMLASAGKLSEREKAIWDEQRNYVLEHKAWLSGNPEATKRDKLALITLKLGKTIFSAAWKIYGFIS